MRGCPYLGSATCCLGYSHLWFLPRCMYGKSICCLLSTQIPVHLSSKGVCLGIPPITPATTYMNEISLVFNETPLLNVPSLRLVTTFLLGGLGSLSNVLYYICSDKGYSFLFCIFTLIHAFLFFLHHPLLSFYIQTVSSLMMFRLDFSTLR